MPPPERPHPHRHRVVGCTTISTTRTHPALPPHEWPSTHSRLKRSSSHSSRLGFPPLCWAHTRSMLACVASSLARLRPASTTAARWGRRARGACWVGFGRKGLSGCPVCLLIMSGKAKLPDYLSVTPRMRCRLPAVRPPPSSTHHTPDAPRLASSVAVTFPRPL